MIENSVATVVPGDGLVHRGPGVVLLLPRLTVGQLPPARALLSTCAAAAGDSSGRTTVLAVAAIVGAGGAQLPAFGLGLDTDQGLVVLLHDDLEAEVQPAGSAPVRLRGTDSLAWVERRFTGGIDNFRLWLPGSPHQTYPGTGTAAAEGIALNLSRGTLHGSGVVLTSTGSGADLMVTAERDVLVRPTAGIATGQPPAAPAAVAPGPDRGYGSMLPPTPQFGQPQIASAEPAEGGAARPGQMSQAHLPIQPHLRNPAQPGPQPGPQPSPHPIVPAAAGTPTEPTQPDQPDQPTEPVRTPGGGIAVLSPNVPPIEGVLCARGHFTDPQAAYCAICGISMQQVSRQITRRPRPPLGVLVLDDGSAMTVDSDLVIGRDPTSHPAVVAGDAKPMYLNDEVDGVSRVHARITLIDWTVCLTDEDSANGTYLTGPGRSGQAVRGEVPVELASGSVIRIGRRTLTFDAFHSAGE